MIQEKNERTTTYIILFSGIFIAIVCCLIAGCISSQTGFDNNSINKSSWEEDMSSITWVAYSPPSADPNKGIEAIPEAMRNDLEVLKNAGFTGLVTYSSDGRLGNELPAIAAGLGYQGLIMGIFDPVKPEEIEAAENASRLSIVKGYCVGNEGLNTRYNLSILASAINELKQKTGKPVTTTEELEDYSDVTLLNLGDWVFPNAHPYFHNFFSPDSAASWTIAAYNDTVKRSKRFVIFKEVGLPTDGDDGRVSETNQDQYYQTLAKSGIRFVYFEAFDQPWKNNLPVEPHWGIFNANRSPKIMGQRLMDQNSLTSGITTVPVRTESTASENLSVFSTKTVIQTTPPPVPFYVYQDLNSQDNHFTPSGYMGDLGDIHINTAYKNNPHSGKTSIQIVYDAKGKGPYTCSYYPPCKWAGIYWQEPPNNWGTSAGYKNYGYNLKQYSKVTFWAKADNESVIEFKVGGISGNYGDSIKYPQSMTANLGPEWKKYEIDLNGEDLSHIIGGFVWVSNWQENPKGATFYLDDIRFE